MMDNLFREELSGNHAATYATIATMRTTEYSKKYRDDLVAILRQNVPKYFSESDVADFKKYLSERNWIEHDVFIDSNDGVIGCASYYRRSASVVGLAWMFFAPQRLGSRRLLPGLKEYLTSVCVRVGLPDSELTLALNTTPRVAKLMSRIGFLTIDVIKNGYGPGYDRVNMERVGARGG
jgi:hypothetical protein